MRFQSMRGALISLCALPLHEGQRSDTELLFTISSNTALHLLHSKSKNRYAMLVVVLQQISFVLYFGITRGLHLVDHFGVCSYLL